MTLVPFPKASARATVLFLNPPYDYEASMGRMEHRFIDHFTGFLHSRDARASADDDDLAEGAVFGIRKAEGL